jgi:hypothetical protein
MKKILLFIKTKRVLLITIAVLLICFTLVMNSRGLVPSVSVPKTKPTVVVEKEIQDTSDKNSPCSDPMKYYTDRFPKTFKIGEKLENWWPIKDGLEYRCKVISSRWDFGKKYVNTEFKLRLVKQSETEYDLKIEGFTEFPYKKLGIDGQRILVDNCPLLVFPLFPEMLYASEKYEKEFLVDVEKYSKDGSIYAPIQAEFWQVGENPDNTYAIRQVAPRGLYMEFKKGFGITKMTVPGGYEIELKEK